MSARDRNAVICTAATDVADRMHLIEWQRVSEHLDTHGSAVIERLLTAAECEALAALYPVDDIFRSRLVMERHGFGRGEYKYFSYPLPDIVAGLRTGIYPHLAPIANRWNKALGIDVRFPRTHAEFVQRCHARHHLPRRGVRTPA